MPVPGGALDLPLDSALEAELVGFRRDLHAHPELGHEETRTTGLVRARLLAEGLSPWVLPGGTGVVCDIGRGEVVELVLRADIDALPVDDEKDVPYRSTVAGVCHACGHDVHTAAVLGAGVVLARRAAEGGLPGRVRLLFQPAEELVPGGAQDATAAGALDRARRVVALHCDPTKDVGTIGTRVGPITAAADRVRVSLRGPGGHTARPHLTADLVAALAAVATGLPAVLSSRVDPRAGMSLVWGHIVAGSAPNAIPQAGVVEGTLRCLDVDAWQEAPDLVRPAVAALVEPYGVRAEVEYVRGVPPVVNDGAVTRLLEAAASAALGSACVVPTEQSLGGEDFGWYLQDVPGALARLGVRPPGGYPGGRRVDLHQGGFDVDERAISVGARVLAAAAVRATAGPAKPA